MKMLYLLFVVALAGCADRPPIQVKVPVTVPCLGNVPQRPAVTFGAGAYPGDKEAAKAALIDSLAFQEYSTRLEVAQAACR
jgi:hypothetical protein